MGSEGDLADAVDRHHGLFHCEGGFLKPGQYKYINFRKRARQDKILPSKPPNREGGNGDSSPPGQRPIARRNRAADEKYHPLMSLQLLWPVLNEVFQVSPDAESLSLQATCAISFQTSV